jgi:beta-mannosidase
MPNQTIALDGTWSLCGFDGYGQAIDTRELPQNLPNLPWIDAVVPGSVYLDLMRVGWIDDVYVGCNTLAAQWVEQHYWFYRRRFDAPHFATGSRCFLVFDGLDLDAIVYLNGNVIGEHHNAFRPLRIDVSDLLAPKENELIVRVDSGLLAAADRRGGDYNLEVASLATKRAHLRKPHFACRWDWSPRLMNVGIGKSVRLETCDVACIQHVVITPQLSDDHRHATLRMRALVENVTRHEQTLALRCRVADTDVAGGVESMMPPGVGELCCELQIEKPKLWWPRPLGDPHLYDVEVALLAGGSEQHTSRRRTGIRRVELRQDPDPGGGRFFHLVINGEPVFCKGANWVPADLLYPSVRPEDYDALVRLASECGCNMLRVWAGGLYADHALLDACDRAGILVWHDFPFACSKFPGDDPAFVREVEEEVRHNVRALAPHPSLVLWCGNNEVELGVRDGWIASYDKDARPCHYLFHRKLADIVAEEDESRPYWPSSPWSPDGSHPNDPSIGDQHPWHVSLGEAKGDYWQYRNDASRFPNEGGMLGPSTLKTLRQILPEHERRVGSRTWLHHDNTQNTWKGEPLLDHLLRVNLCEQPQDLTFEDYARYSAILQGEALETAIDNWRRRKFDTAAAVFWMLNDTWPAAVSWTPIDYYRRRKPAFWYVKRAFADLRAICVELENELAIFVMNDLRQPQPLSLRYGLFAIGGGLPVDQTIDVQCPANSAAIVARLPLSVWDDAGVDTHGAFAVLMSERGELSSHRLFRQRFKRLAWEPAEVQTTKTESGLRLRCERFAWAVCLDADGEHALVDNYFDLIPGVERFLPWPTDLPAPPRPAAANPSQQIVHP